MINKDKIFEGISPENIKDNQKNVVKLINYLNKLHLSERQSKRIEDLIRPIVCTIENYEDYLIKV